MRRSPWQRCLLLLRMTGADVRIVVFIGRKTVLLEKRGWTYGTIGELSKFASLSQSCGAGKRCNGEGESGKGVLHFGVFLSLGIAGIFL